MTVQIVEIGGQKIAMLPMEEYRKLVDLAEDKADTQAAQAAEERRSAGEEYIPSELLDRIMAGENALRCWRVYRGMTQDDLAQRAGTTASRLSEIENGKSQNRPALWRALADALNVSVDDILPMD